MVNIRVRRVCEARINGIEHINYTVSIALHYLKIDICKIQLRPFFVQLF